MSTAKHAQGELALPCPVPPQSRHAFLVTRCPVSTMCRVPFALPPPPPLALRGTDSVRSACGWSPCAVRRRASQPSCPCRRRSRPPSAPSRPMRNGARRRPRPRQGAKARAAAASTPSAAGAGPPPRRATGAVRRATTSSWRVPSARPCGTAAGRARLQGGAPGTAVRARRSVGRDPDPAVPAGRAPSAPFPRFLLRLPNPEPLWGLRFADARCHPQRHPSKNPHANAKMHAASAVAAPLARTMPWRAD